VAAFRRDPAQGVRLTYAGRVREGDILFRPFAAAFRTPPLSPTAAAMVAAAAAADPAIAEPTTTSMPPPTTTTTGGGGSGSGGFPQRLSPPDGLWRSARATAVLSVGDEEYLAVAGARPARSRDSGRCLEPA
jgi:hypothetical protein